MNDIIRTWIDDPDGHHSQFIIKKPRPTWLMDMFGDGTILLQLDTKISRWKRFWTAIMFNTKWRKL